MKLCHCGLPLHYADPETRELVERLILVAGSEYINVYVHGRVWKVQRHYLALHGLKASEIEMLGFDEFVNEGGV